MVSGRLKAIGKDTDKKLTMCWTPTGISLTLNPSRVSTTFLKPEQLSDISKIFEVDDILTLSEDITVSDL